jgi:nickel/cobalt transporter (NicO) family protein
VSEDREVRSLGGLILSGLVPCPAAASIMVLSIAYRSLWVGILSVAAMSLGMGVLLSITGMAAVVFRAGLTRVLSSSKAGAVLEVVLHLAGGILIPAFGIVMFMGSV